jgi:general secretion pathway protein K
MALIVAMLVAALAAAVAISVASGQSQWFAHVALRRDHVQAQSIALAGIQWARQIVDADRPTPTDHLGEPWALPLPATPVENGSVEGRIVDAQGLLNVNNLDGPNAAAERERFARLFNALRIAPATLAALVDWVDADDVEQPGGAEDRWYARATPATLAPNMRVTRIQELAELRGMTPAVLDALIRYVTALPATTPLNVNTAPAAVLAAAIDGVEPATLATFIATRTEQPFASVAAFRQRLPPGAALVGSESMYAVTSHYFFVTVRARQGDTIAQARALLDRSNASTWPRVVWQTLE